MYGNTPPGGSGTPPEYRDFKKGPPHWLRPAGIGGAIVILTLIIVFGSVYTINSGEEAVITRWGRYERTVKTPGLQFKAPFVEKKHIVNVERVERLQFGSQASDDPNQLPEFTSQALMLT